MAQFFVITFKSMPIQPADLSALGTAAAVSGGFTYIFSAFGLYGMALLAISMLLCSLGGAFRPEPTKRNRRLFLTNLLIGALGREVGGLDGHGLERDDEELRHADTPAQEGDERWGATATLEQVEKADHDGGDECPLKQDAQQMCIRDRCSPGP